MLLVVVLIIGILAAIAIPSFLGQRDKAQDASAKSQARTAQTAMETCATDNNGKYTGCDLTKLKAIEPTLTDANNTVAVTPAGAETRDRLLARMQEAPGPIASLSLADQEALRDILRRALAGGHG